MKRLQPWTLAGALAAGFVPALQASPHQAVADQLASCSARHADAASVAAPEHQARLRHAAKNQRELALRLGDPARSTVHLEAARRSLAAQRAQPAGAAELDAGFPAAREACNQLIERNMPLIDGLREGR